MADINFGVNLVPKLDSLYTLGNANYKWNIFASSINGTSVANALLPSVTSSNNGQILKVDNGAWTVGEAPTSLPSISILDNNSILQVQNGAWAVAPLNEMTGATSSANGEVGLVPAPTTSDTDKFLAGDGTWKDGGMPMVILSYGSSTWQDFMTAYTNRVIVYCRASSNSNPASGAQLRMAFMAYVAGSAETPTEVEFQYYRSVSSHSASQMGDQVFVYKLNNKGTWSVTTREASIKQIKAGSNEKIGVAYSGNVVTLSNTMTAADMPMSSSDSTKVETAIENLSAVATGTITKYSTITSGTLDQMTCRKVGNTVYASARIHTMSSVTANGTFLVIPEGFRPATTAITTGYMMIDDVGNCGVLVSIGTNGLVGFGYSATKTTNQVGFAGCWSTI